MLPTVICLLRTLTESDKNVLAVTLLANSLAPFSESRAQFALASSSALPECVCSGLVYYNLSNSIFPPCKCGSPRFKMDPFVGVFFIFDLCGKQPCCNKFKKRPRVRAEPKPVVSV